MNSLLFNFLGVMELCYGEQSLKKPATQKSQALLGYLVMHRGVPQPRERLASLFWGNWSIDKARRNLSTALWRIRRCFPIEVLSSDSQSVYFNIPENFGFDVEIFEELIEKDNIVSLTEAIKVYRGEFLDGFYDDWVVNTRYRLETSYFCALARLMELQTAEGEYEACLEAAQRLIEFDPLREDAHRYVMRSLTCLGQRERALAQYELCRQVLKNELNIEPTVETFELYQDIQEGRLTIAESVKRPTTGGVSPKIELPTSLEVKGHDPQDVFALSRMVGREDEMAFLDQCWEWTRSGRGSFLLISGEAGVGKSRLVSEFRQKLHASGVPTSISRCYEFEGALPYLPITEAIRNTFRKQRTLEELPTWALVSLSDLIPEIIDKVTERKLTPLNQGNQNQARLFQSILAYLTHLTRKTPALLVLEDLHWAGVSTLELIHYMVRNLSDSPVFIIGTFRPESLDRNHLLSQLNDLLTQEGSARTLTLECLTEDDVHKMIIEASGAGDAVNLFTKRLFQDSEGNPFYLIEIIKALFESEIIKFQDNSWKGDFQAISRGDFPLPSSISRAIKRRAEHLNKTIQSVLETASVIGQAFDHDLLGKVNQSDEEFLLEAIDDLLRFRFIEESSPEVNKDYQFVHHKIQEVVYESLPINRRAFLHRRTGEALENLIKLGRTDLTGEIAYHFYNAQKTDRELLDKSITYLNMAGNQARNLYAHQEAVNYYKQALGLYKEIGAEEAAARTLMKIGLTYHNAFEYEQARQAFDESFVLLRQVAWVNPTQHPPAPHPLRYWSPIEPNTFDPAACFEFCMAKIIHQIYRGPLTLKAESDVMPALFQSWEVSPDGRHYTFHLLKDSYWSDGHPLSASDFEFAWKRVLDPALDSRNAELFYIFKNARSYHQREIQDPNLLGIKTQDGLTLEVELEEPVGYFLYLLTTHIASPFPQHLQRKYDEDLMKPWRGQREFVSNGFFLISSWTPGEGLILTRNPKFSGESCGNLDEVRVYFMEWPDALNLYESGSLDVLDLTYLTKEQKFFLYRRYPEDFLTVQMQTIIFAHLNTDVPPFDDILVRRAFAHAIDKRLMAHTVIDGDPAFGGIIPPGIPGYTPDIGFSYNPELGRDLLAQAGYPRGKNFSSFDAYAQANPRYTLLNEELARQWRQNLGIDVKWVWFPTDEFFTRSMQDEPHLICYGLAEEYPDPEYFLYKGIFPYMRSKDFPSYMERVRAGSQILDSAERIAWYQALDKSLIDKAIIIPLVYPRFHMLVKPWVKRFPLSQSARGAWKDVVIEPHT